MVQANTTSGETSYQHSYQSVQTRDNEDEKDGGNGNGNGVQEQPVLPSPDRIWRTAKVLVFLVSVALVWYLVSTMTYNEEQEEEESLIVVDDRGILYDGPGSDGSCNDTAFYFHDQLVDHFANNDDSHKKKNQKWTQKYFVNDDYFQGPGYPIFYIMGGEDAANCLFYPFVTHTLARIFGGLTLEAEHRFYGSSQPIDVTDDNVHDMLGLLTPDQAMADFVRLLKVKQHEYGCSPDKSSHQYCPVITVGGSYPGFLSAMMRVLYRDVVDIAYASSAPLPLYAQQVDANAYFDLVTVSAERASPGCPDAVQTTLDQIQNDLLAASDDTLLDWAARLGICVDNHKLPEYIRTTQMLNREVQFTVPANFADLNMDNYPPSPETDLARACHVFQDDSKDAYEKMHGLWAILQPSVGEEDDATGTSDTCFDMHTQIPDGPNATVSGSDWTGSGDGKSGMSWEFQCCTDLVVQTGLGPKSMFPPHPWTLEALTEHCQARFGVVPTPTRMVDQWHFDNLAGPEVDASRILLVNGLNDGWSATSILQSLSPSIIAINIPHGAHHSELGNYGPRSDGDTDEVKQTYQIIIDRLTMWLEEIKAAASSH